MRIRRAGRKLWAPKISGSGWKVTVVPRRLGVGPIFFKGARGLPREKDWA